MNSKLETRRPARPSRPGGPSRPGSGCPELETVAIIGVGLIGGSLGIALKQRHLVKRVIGIGRRRESLQRAIKVAAIDTATTDPALGVKEADIVVLAAPVGDIIPLLSNIVPHLKPGAIITDVGSTKKEIVEQATSLVPDHLYFVGGHPLTGAESSGVDNAKGELFVGATWVLTPTSKTNPRALFKISSLCQAIGARMMEMDPAEHDRMVAVSSHLPHVLAALLVNIFSQYSEQDDRIKSLVAGGFRDMTRIAASSPVLWRDICLENQAPLLEVMAHFKNMLNHWELIIKEGKGDELLEEFAKARRQRTQMVILNRDE
ncbi:MAG: prephenate dehydrogenase [bacterium]|nr:prephenate dehydrogenase [bacterium]